MIRHRDATMCRFLLRMKNRSARFVLGLATVLALALPAAAQQPHVTKTYGLTLGDKLRYPKGFTHFDYANPDAPKGGSVRLYSIGGFDSFNPFIIKGDPPAGVGLMFESLMVGSEDDALGEYGLIAESVEVPDDLSWVIYNLRPEAKFSDGSPITADDVIWSLETLKTEGAPTYRFYYKNIAKAEKLGPHRVKFVFSGPRNRELPQITGELPVLSKAYWSKVGFDRTTLDPPVTSGPYTIASFEPNRYVVLKRNPDYWGRDLPVRRGLYNYDEIRYDFYRDETVALEAFKAGLYDYRFESASKTWATGYDFPALTRGAVIKEEVPNKLPTGMQGFAFNLRREKFGDINLREALDLAFDFQWSNKHLFYGQYVRTESYFSNTELASQGLPSKKELKLLEPLRGQIPDPVFTQEYKEPETDGSGVPRANLRKAASLLQKAGYTFDKGRLLDPKTHRPLTIEFLLAQPAFERVVTPYLQNLKRLGIGGNIRTIDPAAYQNRVRDFDFDAVVTSIPQSLSPGNEQRDYWTSEAAARPGSRNIMGIKNAAVDKLVDALIAAPDREFSGHRHPCPRPCLAVAPLRRAALAHHQLPPRLLEPVRHSQGSAFLRNRLLLLVDRSGEGRGAGEDRAEAAMTTAR